MHFPTFGRKHLGSVQTMAVCILYTFFPFFLRLRHHNGPAPQWKHVHSTSDIFEALCTFTMPTTRARVCIRRDQLSFAGASVIWHKSFARGSLGGSNAVSLMLLPFTPVCMHTAWHTSQHTKCTSSAVIPTTLSLVARTALLPNLQTTSELAICQQLTIA
ncbi:unnamed protein product [Ectocarpus sp. 8 AP-2014]